MLFGAVDNPHCKLYYDQGVGPAILSDSLSLGIPLQRSSFTDLLVHS